jgi:gp32 DNA binding protein like
MALDIEKLKQSFEKKSGRGGMELKDGDNNIRILPPSTKYLAETVDYISFDYWIHYKLGPEGKTNEVCPKTVSREARCPICEAVAKLYRLNTPEDKELAGRLRNKMRHMFNVIDLNDKEKGVQILEVGINVYKDLVSFITHPKWGDLLDIDKGRDVTITKTNRKETKSGYEEYSVAPDPTVSSAREYLPKNFKEAINQLQKAVPVAKPYKELQAILEGGDSNVDVGAVKATSAVEDENTESEENNDQPSAEADPETVDKPQLKTALKKEEPKEKEEVKGKNPGCFGEDYGPRRTECVSCKVKVDCRDKFLES